MGAATAPAWPTRTLLAAAFASSVAPPCRAQEWRVYNSATVHGTLSIAELEFYSDAACSKRLAVANGSPYASPLPPELVWKAPVQHAGEDCWGKCQSNKLSGYCNWCGEENACCKSGFHGDPAECKSAVGFTANHHECVAIATEGPLLAERRAFDGNPKTAFEVTCPPQGCSPGSVVLGAVLAKDVGVHCIVVLQAAGAANTAAIGSNAPPQFQPQHAHRASDSCPGICRSGRYLEGDKSFGCREYLSQHGWCGNGPGYKEGTNCTGCHSLRTAAWEETALTSANVELRASGALVASRLRDTSGVVRDLPGALRGKPFKPVLLHPGEDCWARCGGRAGYCSWCGEGNACCKRDSDQDPPECKEAVAFTVVYHECVALAAPSPLDSQPYLISGIFVAVWGTVCAGMCLLLRRRRRSKPAHDPYKIAESKSLSGDIARRPPVDDTHERKRLKEKVNKLQFVS